MKIEMKYLPSGNINETEINRKQIGKEEMNYFDINSSVQIAYRQLIGEIQKIAIKNGREIKESQLVLTIKTK